MAVIVEVKGLTKKYGELTAVENLSFEVHEREIFGFLGPNGAGKSTTLNVLSTLLAYDCGEILIGGMDLSKNPRGIQQMLGLIPQEIAVYPLLSAYENVAYFASLYGLKGKALKTCALEALEFVGLTEHIKMRASKMSGGMKRRLNIACGIAHKPRLIVMDEPTVGVDAQSREHILQSIGTLRDEGATVIYTSHYMPEVQEICDRIAIIDHGRLAGIGTKEALLQTVTDIRSIYIDVQASVQEAESLSAMIKEVPGVRKARFEKELSRFKIDVGLDFGALSAILRIFIDADIDIGSIQNETPNLETTFLALTGRELR